MKKVNCDCGEQYNIELCSILQPKPVGGEFVYADEWHFEGSGEFKICKCREVLHAKEMAKDKLVIHSRIWSPRDLKEGQ